MKYFDKMCLLPRNLIANYLKHIWKSSLKTLVKARSAAGQVALKILKLSEFELIQTVHTLTVHTVHTVQVCSCADVVCTYCAGSVSNRYYLSRIYTPQRTSPCYNAHPRSKNREMGLLMSLYEYEQKHLYSKWLCNNFRPHTFSTVNTHMNSQCNFSKSGIAVYNFLSREIYCDLV